MDSDGNQLAAQMYDTSKDGLNIYQKSIPGSSLAWNTNDNTLGLVISRTMTRSDDGLNHQGAIAVVLDGNDMSIIQNWGATSSHSWANSVHAGNTNNRFLGADLGDNYPRGINLFEFSENEPKETKVVYTFKTKHCDDPEGSCLGRNPPVYEEISSPQQTFYQQSNDNEVCA